MIRTLVVEMKKTYWLYALMASAALVVACSDDSDGSNSGSSDVEQNSDKLCGNNTVDEGENCDDGNTVDGDGCSAVCHSEDGYTCPATGGKCTKKDQNDNPVVVNDCGNGELDAGEFCDDGNTKSNDGCSDKCAVEEGYSCHDPGKPCTRDPVCGDGKLDDNELCDDANTVSGDGCSDHCVVEEGYNCPIVGQLCATMFCGDGEVQTENGEECDDSEDFNVEYGNYEGMCATNCHYAHYCGDGLLDEVDIKNGEECDSKDDDSPNQYNGCSLDCKRVNYCGDGKISHNELCDDGNTLNGDGCSATCEYEQGFACATIDGKTVCQPIACGNGKLDKNENCDDGNRVSGDGCNAACLVEPGYQCVEGSDGVSVCSSTVGNGILDSDAGEECDDGNTLDGDGCSSKGAVEPGWICPTVNAPCSARACGDGILALGEECDDGNTNDGDGCSYRCNVETGFNCKTPGKPCEQGSCGDGVTQKGEQCDDGNTNDGDGCSSTCMIEPYYECKTEGGDCHSVTCGDGSIKPSDGYTSFESCDLGADNNNGSLGCSSKCTILEGWHCDENGQNCAQGKCGDGFLDIGEACDDGNTLPADGCSPACQQESGIECKNGACTPICGDGVTMWKLGEECDDGNLVSGDGCSSSCTVETGFSCTEFASVDPPAFITLPITYRDFRSDGLESVSNVDTLSDEAADGYVTSKLMAKYPEAGWTSSNLGKPLPDFNSQGGCQKTGYTLKTLDSDGKPVLNPNPNVYKVPSAGAKYCFHSPAEFAMWYRYTPGINREVKSKLYLWLQDKDNSVYYFTSVNPTTNGAPNACVDGQAMENNYYLPLASAGYGVTPSYESRHANYSFTSEVKTYFQYKGGESLTFSGDDDLWVFLNGRLFVDLGGLHGSSTGIGTLQAKPFETTDGSGNKKTINYDPNYDVYEGGIYEISLFHAERNATGSNFSLTLTGFVNTGTATCDALCGDGIIRGGEECDYVGINTDTALQFEKGCSSTCKLEPHCGNHKIEAGEQCDEGTSGNDWCTSSCKLNPDTCGNGALDAHEQCDYAITDASDPNYHKGCLETCRISGCGDGILDRAAGEECDDGNTSNEDMCSSQCKLPYCGDGFTQAFLGEVCDDGVNDGAYGHCGLGCSYQPPYCGDGIVSSAYEACDDGVNDGSYDGCMPGCQQRAAYCGDGVVQDVNGEECDPADTSSSIACSSECKISIL